MCFRLLSPVLAISLTVLCACSGPRIVENTPTAISIRYDPVVDSLEDVTAAANKACGSYGKTARRRESEGKKTLVNRYAHFECLSN